MARQAAGGALLTVNADVLGADVFVNGRSVGSTPLDEVEVPAGELDVVIKKQGFKDGSDKVHAVLGKESSLSIRMIAVSDVPLAVADRTEPNLTPPLTDTGNPDVVVTRVEENKPIYKTWYFWVGAAAVVVAIAAGTAVGVSQANKGLDEKAICQGKCDACINFSCSGNGLLPLPGH